jgi:transposase InsO family protein
MTFGFIEAEKASFPISQMCRVLGVSQSGFFAWQERPACRRQQLDMVYLAHIRTAFALSNGTYGSPRMHRDLVYEGHEIGRHRTARLMRQNQLIARQKRRFKRTTDSEHAWPVAPNLIAQDFAADGPDRKWGADISYIWTAEGWLYLAIVLDLFSRRIVGWSMSASMTAKLVIDALTMALWRRGKPDALLHHSDQGSQYTSEAFQRLLADHGVDCSMSRSGNCWDNAAMESFFSSLKTERVSRRTYRTRDEAKADVFDYIERFYNPKRRHSTIGYLSPIAFEEKMALA